MADSKEKIASGDEADTQDVGQARMWQQKVRLFYFSASKYKTTSRNYETHRFKYCSLVTILCKLIQDSVILKQTRGFELP